MEAVAGLEKSLMCHMDLGLHGIDTCPVARDNWEMHEKDRK